MPKKATLPLRCIKCGDDVTSNDAKGFTRTWQPPWVAIFLLASPLIFIIIALIVQKQGKFQGAVCAAHRALRWRWLLAGWFLILFVAPGTFVLGCTALNGNGLVTAACFIVSVIAFISGIIMAAAGGQPFQVGKIDRDFLYLKKTSAKLLDPPPGADANGHWNAQGQWVVGAQWGATLWMPSTASVPPIPQPPPLN